jgi:uncharacterized membrane protein
MDKSAVEAQSNVLLPVKQKVITGLNQNNSETVEHFMAVQCIEMFQKIVFFAAASVFGFMAFEKIAPALILRYPWLAGSFINIVSFLYFLMYNAENIAPFFAVMAGAAMTQHAFIKFVDYITQDQTDILSKDSSKQVVPSASNTSLGTLLALNVLGIATLAVAVFFWCAMHRFGTHTGKDQIPQPQYFPAAAPAA